MPLSDIEDPVFASKIMGEGVAIDPKDGVVYSPVGGVVIMLSHTKHAIGLRTASGIEVLIHIGLDSEIIEDEFKVYVVEKQSVERGQKLITFNVKKLKRKGFNLTTPVVVTNSKDYMDIVVVTGDKVDVGDSIIAVI